MKSRSVREEAVRLVLLLAGLCVAHLGVTLFLQTDLGSDPFNVFVQGLFRFLPWPGFMTYGRVHLLVSLVIMVVLLWWTANSCASAPWCAWHWAAPSSMSSPYCSPP